MEYNTNKIMFDRSARNAGNSKTGSLETEVQSAQDDKEMNPLLAFVAIPGIPLLIGAGTYGVSYLVQKIL